MLTGLKPILVYNPVTLPSIRSSSFVEYKRLPHPYNFGIRKHRLVSPCRLPEPGSSGSIRSSATWVLSIFVTEEVPFTLLLITMFAPIYKSKEKTLLHCTSTNVKHHKFYFFKYEYI